MLSVLLQIHRNILSAQCHIRYVDDDNSINTLQVKCASSELQLLFLRNDEIVKRVNIITPKDFFIPSSLVSDSHSAVKSNSTLMCRIAMTPAGQSVGECSFRLQISGTELLDQSESELKVDVKDFFKERFKSCTIWNLCCSTCGADLPFKPMFIERIQEYSESELSEGWFCHGNGPQEKLQPSSRTLYMDETSFYLCPVPDASCNCKKTTVLDEKCCICLDANCQKDGCFSIPSTNSSDVAYSHLPGINCSDKSTIDCCVSKSIDQSYLKLEESSTKSCVNQSCDNKKNSDDINGYLNRVIECQSCGNVLTSEKPPLPFIRFYIDKLKFQNSSFNDNHSEYAHKIALLSFWSLVTRSQTSLLPSKLLLQSKVCGEELCLLLWIPSAPLSQFSLQDSIKDIPLEIHMRTEPVYKVLYFTGTSQSENVRSWRHDFGVDFYNVSDTMVKVLSKILDTSASHLPKTSDAKGFSCGFLSAPSHLLLG